MDKNYVRTITSTFGLSILSLLGMIATIIIIFALGLSGFNLQLSTSTCSGQAYFTIRLYSAATLLEVHTVTGLISVCLAILILILVIQIYWPLRSLPSEQQPNRQNNKAAKPNKKTLTVLYLLASCECLCMVSNGGGNLSLLIDNNSCAYLDRPALVALTVTSMVALLSAIAQMVLIIVIDISTPSVGHITLKELQKSSQVSKEEEAMSKHLQKQRKEYYSNNNAKKEDMMESLLKGQQEVYAKKEREFQQGTADQAIPVGRVATNSEESQGSSQQHNQLQGSSQQRNQPSQKKKDKKNKTAALMHASHQNYNTKGQGQEDNAYFQPKNTPIEQQQSIISEAKIDEQLLYAKQDDNLSEKFDESNFELSYDLERAIRFQKDEDLSHLELKQLMNFTKASFSLKSNNDQQLIFEKTYEEPEGFIIRVNFAKIKEHKQHLKNQIQKLKQNHNPVQNTQSNPKDEKKGEDLEEEKPITEEISKLLKVILFDNSEFYKKNPEKQTCPIAKYVENDDGFEVIQTNEKEGKHKKIEYSKQQLLFSKKRKENVDEAQLKEKGTVRAEFNQLQFIKMERRAIFGEEDADRFAKQEMGGAKLGKMKKRKLVQAIRSKYYE